MRTKLNKVVAIIPARGGSKGLPGKNIALLNGRPLIDYSIARALNTPQVAAVYVTTDCPDIAAVASACGAQVVRRPSALATDDASSESALLHALDVLEAEQEMDLVVFLQCTSPLRRAHDIEAAIAQFRDEQADSLLSVTASHHFLWRPTESGAQSLNYDYRQRPRRQDMTPQYCENGSLYLFTPAGLRRTQNRLSGKISLFEMAAQSAIDIDTKADFEMAEWLLQAHPEFQ